MVELKPKFCATTLCVCRGPLGFPSTHVCNQSSSVTTHIPNITSSPTPIRTEASSTTTPLHTRGRRLATTYSATSPSFQQGHRHNQLHPLSLRYLSPQSKMASGLHASRIVRKYRRSRLKRVKRQEYRKLREMVPALHERPKVSKVEVIEEAIKYIDELHSALIQRFRARGLPAVLKDVPVEAREVHGGNIRELVRHLLATSNPASLPPSRIENARTLPSFMQKISKARRL